mmetsp:Transcript_4864/g.10726  ORF Transcript_4864/g.10726 Transcript_4864/m.10726 type:complete len:206 (+) Transcript_4864:933-1550(+)
MSVVVFDLQPARSCSTPSPRGFQVAAKLVPLAIHFTAQRKRWVFAGIRQTLPRFLTNREMKGHDIVRVRVPTIFAFVFVGPASFVTVVSFEFRIVAHVVVFAAIEFYGFSRVEVLKVPRKEPLYRHSAVKRPHFRTPPTLDVIIAFPYDIEEFVVGFETRFDREEPALVRLVGPFRCNHVVIFRKEQGYIVGDIFVRPHYGQRGE